MDSPGASNGPEPVRTEVQAQKPMFRPRIAEAMKLLAYDPKPRAAVAVDGGFVVRKNDQ